MDFTNENVVKDLQNIGYTLKLNGKLQKTLYFNESLPYITVELNEDSYKITLLYDTYDSNNAWDYFVYNIQVAIDMLNETHKILEEYEYGKN